MILTILVRMSWRGIIPKTEMREREYMKINMVEREKKVACREREGERTK